MWRDWRLSDGDLPVLFYSGETDCCLPTILPQTSSPVTGLSPNHQQPHPFHVGDLSFYPWTNSHDLVHSTIILISSLRDSSFPSLLLIYVPMKTSLKSFREQDKITALWANLHDSSDETPTSWTTFPLPNTHVHMLILSTKPRHWLV